MRARRLLATVTIAVGALLVTGCVAPMERPPVFDLFSGEQRTVDRLPHALVTWVSLLQGTSRMLGEVEGYR
ncbi:hypothetical protein [Cryobacterium sp. BB307]|uniref:hypothetical protein n=1 Tax=Cryobacterium sp. BB307 TaxID=2716317 RepID=UPI001445A4D4|nr:hypothetical protein [Cryobacterium sp. BB307]